MRRTRADWGIPLSLITLSLVPALAGAVRAAELVSGTLSGPAGRAAITPENARFFASPFPILLHIVAILVYSMLGALQFSEGFRRRRRGWHRVAGGLVVASGVLVATTGLWMTRYYPWPPGDGQLVYLERLVFGSAMLLFLVLAMNAVRQRNFAAHGRWMIRAYAIGLGAGTQVFTHLPWFLVSNEKPGELLRGLMMGAGWIINVLVAEWIIRAPRRVIRMESGGRVALIPADDLA